MAKQMCTVLVKRLDQSAVDLGIETIPMSAELIGPKPGNGPRRDLQRSGPVHSLQVRVIENPRPDQVKDVLCVPHFAGQVKGLSAIDQELVAIQFPDVFCVQRSSVVWLFLAKGNRDVGIETPWPIEAALRISLPLDTASGRKLDSEKREFVTADPIRLLAQDLQSFREQLGKQRDSSAQGVCIEQERWLRSQMHVSVPPLAQIDILATQIGCRAELAGSGKPAQST